VGGVSLYGIEAKTMSGNIDANLPSLHRRMGEHRCNDSLDFLLKLIGQKGFEYPTHGHVSFYERKGAGWCQMTSSNPHDHTCTVSCQVGHEQRRREHVIGGVSRMLHCNPFRDTEDIDKRQ